MTPARHRARIEESLAETDRLTAEVDAWIAKRHEADLNQQYKTQLTTLHTQLGGALQLVRTKLSAVDPTTNTGAVYSACRDNDYRRAFIHRMYYYYRTKFDQRDGPLRDLLRAADEVVWSCYSEAFANAGVAVGPTPLAYVEPRFSPVATPRVDPPPDLDNTADRLLIGALQGLPIPLISLPPTCVKHPWWLIHLAHEAGHHVQYDLGNRRLIAEFESAVRAAALAANNDDAEADRWARWAIELFADCFALLVAGPWTAWSIAELESSVEPELLEDRDLYPPRLVRMGFLRAVTPTAAERIDAHTLAVADALADVAVPDNIMGRQLTTTFATALSVATGITEVPLGDHGSLCDLSGWNVNYFKTGGEVATWRGRYAAGNEPLPQDRRESARLALAGAVAAWAAIAGIVDDGERSEKRERLAGRVLALIPECHHAGVRSATTSVPAAQLEESLAGILTENDPAELR